DLAELLRDICEKPPERPSLVAPARAVPPVLEEVALKALAKAKGERFATARLLYDEVQRWLERESDLKRRSLLAAERAAAARALLGAYHGSRAELEKVEQR